MNSIKDRGFTLVEVLIGAAILSLVLAGIYGILESSLDSWNYGRKRIDLQQNARIALNMIERDIREAEGVSISESQQKTELIIKKPDEEITYYRYKSDSTLLRDINYEGHNPVAYNIKDFRVNFDPYPVVSVTLEVEEDEVNYVLSSKIFSRKLVY